MSTGRALPYSAEVEELLISCCLVDAKDMIPRCVVARITMESFYEPKYGEVYAVMLDMFSDKKEIDTATLAEELRSRKLLDELGGYPFILQISRKAATTAQGSFFIDKVREYATLRALIRANTRIVEDCYGYTGDMESFLSTAEKGFLGAVTAYNTKTDAKTLDQVCADIAQEAKDMLSGKSRGDENDLSWGISDLDKYLKKFRRGELVVLAARPGVGKSSLMRQVAIRNVIRDGKNVCVFTLEVTMEEYIRNTAQALSGVNPREIDRYSSEEQQAFIKWCERIGAFKNTLHVHDINASLANILAQIRIHNSRLPVDMVFIDYLQLLNEKQVGGENRDQLLGKITRALKMLANELKCIIVVISQLNRSSEKDNRPPILSDLRESGNIEQDADRVVFIYRPLEKRDGTKNDATDDTIRFFYSELLQRKGRNVGENSVCMNFERLAARFLPIAKDHTHAPTSPQLF